MKNNRIELYQNNACQISPGISILFKILPNLCKYLATTVQKLDVKPIKAGNEIHLVNLKFLNLVKTKYNNRKD